MVCACWLACEMNIHAWCVGTLNEACQGSRRKKAKSSIMESLRFKRRPTGNNSGASKYTYALL